MKIFVLGAAGMLGHKIFLKLNERFDTWAVARADYEKYSHCRIFNKNKFIGGVDFREDGPLFLLLDRHAPDVVINCVGITLRKIDAGHQADVVRLNALLPHQLHAWTLRGKRRLIHFSTDCVFNGERGLYREGDTPDARDLYGLSKLLGEVAEAPALTIRSSIIGRELFHKTEFIEWFISRRGKSVKGFTNVFYSGVTTNYMAYLVEQILLSPKNIHGLYHLASPRISKYEILKMVNQSLDLGIEIEADAGKKSDKSLVGNRLFEILDNVEKQGWPEMIAELRNDNDLYRD